MILGIIYRLLKICCQEPSDRDFSAYFWLASFLEFGHLIRKGLNVDQKEKLIFTGSTHKISNQKDSDTNRIKLKKYQQTQAACDQTILRYTVI